MKTQPLVVYLTDGITDSTSDADARKPGITYCENVDFSRMGEVQGRPAAVSHNAFGLRTLDTNALPTFTDTGTQEFSTLNFDFGTLFRYRDSLGERPGLAATGRVWTWEGKRWADRMYTGSTRFERISNFGVNVTNIGIARGRQTAGYNFCPLPPSISLAGSPLLSPATNPSTVAYQPGTNSYIYGSACDILDPSTGDVHHCVVGLTDPSSSSNLVLVTRKNEDVALTVTTLKTDVALGTYVSCCTDDTAGTTFNAATFFVSYQKTGGAGIGVMRVSVSSSSVATIAAQVTYTIANVAQTAIASNTHLTNLVVAITRTGTAGVACRSFSPSTCTNIPAGDAQFNSGSTGTIDGDVVIGFEDEANGSRFVLAYLDKKGGGSCFCVIIGRYIPNIPSTAILKSLNSDNTLGGFTIAHQPIRVAGPGTTTHPRVVVGVTYNHAVGIFGGPGWLGTYFALDVTDLVVEGTPTVSTGGTAQPGILAMGMVDTSASVRQSGVTNTDVCRSASAVVSQDKLSYRFASWEYKEFLITNLEPGLNPQLGINQVTLTRPKAATVGEETILSGSAPHSIARGYSVERFFAQESPEMLATVVPASGGVWSSAGSVTFQALWMYVDDAGVEHRSAPSQIAVTKTLAATTDTISLAIENLVLHSRETGTTYIELYCSQVNPTATSPRYRVQTLPQSATAVTAFTLTSGGIDTLGNPRGPIIYTNNGAVLQHLPVKADGGIAVLNHRVFISDGKSVYASTLSNPVSGSAPGWNDEGPLTIQLPSPAGRVLALEALDDKLLIFCDHGVYYTQGDGPDDTGLGQQFLSPVQITDLGVSGELGTIKTSHGVVFHAANNTAQGLPGWDGLYLISRNLQVSAIGVDVQEQLSGINGFTVKPCFLSYIPEKDLLVVNPQRISSLKAGLLVLDMRAGQTPGEWSLWTSPNCNQATNTIGGPCLAAVSANGVLWGLYGKGGLLKQAIVSFEGLAGTDAAADSGDVTHDYKMLVKTNKIFANGADGAGWAKVRSVTPIGNATNNSSSNPYTQSITVEQDQGSILTTSTAVVSPGGMGPNITWPLNRDVLEFRLPNQKCSQLTITLEGIPAVARWSAIRLDIFPSRGKAPAFQRR